MAYTPYHLACAGQNDALLQMKNTLKLHGWTVPDSGDGRSVFSTPASGIYGAGTDVITLTSGSSFYAANNIANGYAWFRLLSPLGAGGPELIFVHLNGNYGSHAYAVWLCTNATADVYPNATSDYAGDPPELFGRVFARPRSLGLPDAGTSVFFSAVAGTLHMMVGDASENYAFYAIYENTATRALSGVFFDAVEAAEGSDESPFVVYVTGNQANGMQVLTDGRTFYAGPSNNVFGVGPNPTGHMGAYLSKTDDRDPMGEYQRKLFSYAMPLLCNGYTANSQLPFVVNPYGTEYDVMMGAGWFFINRAFANQVPNEVGKFKGRSRLIRGFGGSTAANGVTNTARTLLHYGSGIWLPWDGVTAVAGDVVVNEHPHFDALEYTETEEEVLGVEMFVGDLEYTEFGVAARGVLNRVWDTVAGRFVVWATAEADTAGAEYPGPGAFGVDTSDYCVESDEAP